MTTSETSSHTTIAEQTDAEALDALKAQADLLGISYSTNIGYETLSKRITAVLDENKDAVVAPLETTEQPVDARKAALDDALKLVRVRVSCHDPMKKEYTGEVFSVVSGQLGVFKRFVQFGEEWHVPNIILKLIATKQYQQFQKIKLANGHESVKAKLVNAYSIEYLPALSAEELEALAADQTARHAID